MAIYRTYCCPDCQGKFQFLHHPNTEPPPDYCPLCGANVSGKKKKKKLVKSRETGMLGNTAVSGESRMRARTLIKSENQVYRQLESSSEYRMEQAAKMLGCSSAELSSMKLTNMKDNVKSGESSHIPSPAAKVEGQVIDIQHPGMPGRGLGSGFGGTSAQDYAKSVGQGPHPFAGNAAREMVVSGHAGRAHQMETAGRMNKKD